MDKLKKTRHLWVDPGHPEPAVIKAAAEVIRAGGTVAFPTETVYGLGANALDPEAVKKIFQAKGRPRGNPLIVHVAAIRQARELVANWPLAADVLARKLWPGPLTVILPRAPVIPDEVTSGLSNVALRVPAHPIALALIEASETPLAAPSANLSGRPSPTQAAHVWTDLAGKIDLILDGGPADLGVESTILDLSGPCPVLLRPGGIAREEIEKIIQTQVEIHPAVLGGKFEGEEGELAPCPGTKFKHYAPEACVLMVMGSPEEQVIKIKNYLIANPGSRVGVLATVENFPAYKESPVPPAYLAVLGPRNHFEEIATRLFGALRACDQAGVDVVLVETIPAVGIGLAVMNRLRRAAENRAL